MTPPDFQTIVANSNRFVLESIAWSIGSGVVLGLIIGLIGRYARRPAVRYYVRKNKLEFLTGIFAIVGYFISYIFVENHGASLLLSIVVTLIATITIIYARTREKDFYFLSLQKTAHKEDWIGEGIFQYDRVYNAYAITNSPSGFIFSKCLIWSDYVFNFEFKILNTSVGVILRATNLSNLIMLQVLETGIRAHIRINGFWKIWEEKETKLIFGERLSLDQWYRGRFECDKGSIRIRLYDSDNKLTFDRDWKIPAGQISFSYDPPGDGVGLVAKIAVSAIPFSINLEYGTAGFRNDGGEKAMVRNMLIEKIQGVHSAEGGSA